MNDFDERDLLARELRDRSSDIGGHPIDLESVKGRARGIQRRRTIVAGAVAATVLAVAVPAGISVTHALDPVQYGPAGHPTQRVSKDDTNPGQGRIVTLRVDGLDRGPAPAIDFFDRNSDLVTPDGVLQFPVDLRSAVRESSGRWQGLGSDGPGATSFYSFDSGLRVDFKEQSGERMVVSPDGHFVSYVRTGGPWAQQLVSEPINRAQHPQDEEMTWGWHDTQPPVEPIGFVGPNQVVYQTLGKDSQVWLAGPGQERTRLPGLIGASSASPVTGLVAGQQTSTPTGACSGVVDPSRSTPAPLWSTCDYRLGKFSPDGRYVLAGDAYADGLGDRSAAILDARTGEVVVGFQQPKDGRLTITDTAWENDDTVLAIVVDGQTWSIVRLSLDGGMQQTIDQVKSSPYGDFPLRFPAQ